MFSGQYQAGFSLLEVLLSIMLFAVFLSVSILILNSGFSMLDLEVVDPGIKQELELTGLRISQDIIRSEKIRFPEENCPDAIELMVLNEEKSMWLKYSKYSSTFGEELALQVETTEAKDYNGDSWKEEVDYTRRDSILNQIEDVSFQLSSNSQYLKLEISREGKGGGIYTWQKNIILLPETKIL